MATRTTHSGYARDVYLDLVRELPLRPIRSEEELKRATQVVDALTSRKNLSQAEEDYLDVLGDLVERYEAKEHPVPPASDADMLRHLMEAKGVTQAKVARETEITESTISEVLSGKRSLTRAHIGRLSSYFHVSPGAFAFKE